MNLLDRAKHIRLPVTWETIRCAWEGMAGRSRLLTAAEVQTFALNKVASASGDELTMAAVLTSPDRQDEISEILSRLAPEVSERAVRACRVLQVHEVLDQLPNDPVDGLMGLTSLWARLGLPADSPHIVQGRGNAITPAEYFTAENFESIVSRHRDWITQELTFLRA